MEQLPSQTIEIAHQSSVGLARRTARHFAEKVGFDAAAREEIALAMTELATNLLKYAPGGKLTLLQVSRTERCGLEIQSKDSGPGIADIEAAITDGFSTGGSRGTGLGAVNRLMDEFDIVSHRGTGTRIVCRKWLREYKPTLRECPLAFGVASRPLPKCDVNGDAFVVKQWAESALVGIIDGLGHGQFAHRAAQTARSFVESHFDLPLVDIFRGVSRACRATRGVVMALARFDWVQGKMSFASVGNIEVRVYPPSELYNFRIRRGILGMHGSQPKLTEHSWSPESTMVLLSDGLRTHWGWKNFPELLPNPPGVIAQELLRLLAREEDDATVLVVGRNDREQAQRNKTFPTTAKRGGNV